MSALDFNPVHSSTTFVFSRHGITGVSFEPCNVAGQATAFPKMFRLRGELDQCRQYMHRKNDRPFAKDFSGR